MARELFGREEEDARVGRGRGGTNSKVVARGVKLLVLKVHGAGVEGASMGRGVHAAKLRGCCDIEALIRSGLEPKQVLVVVAELMHVLNSEVADEAQPS